MTIDPETIDQTDGDTRTIWPKTLDLAKLTAGYEAQNGQTLTGTLAGSHQLTIADGATVTLSNAVVASLADDAGFAGLTCLGDATIILAGSDTNIVNGAEDHPGIFVPTNHTLTIQGDGALAATGGKNAAGIGSGYNSYNGYSCGDITILSGTVEANGTSGGAGIGSGYGTGSTCGDITISGGTVVATGRSGAGIGSGANGSTCGDITISGGSVEAKSGYDSAGIGSGCFGSSCGAISIGVGIVKVVATRGSSRGEIIGSGESSTCGTVTIDPETIERTDRYTRTILPKTVALSTLAGGYEAQNGQTLTGTLAGSHQLTIADGATVTLSQPPAHHRRRRHRHALERRRYEPRGRRRVRGPHLPGRRDHRPLRQRHQYRERRGRPSRHLRAQRQDADHPGRWHARRHRRQMGRRHRQRLHKRHLRQHHDLGWHGHCHR